MSHEIFTIERAEKIEPVQEHRAEYLLEKLIAAEDVGLKNEAFLIGREIVSIERGGLIKTAPLTDDELAIWRAWLPTAYSDRSKYGMVDQWSRAYSFDRVPAPVLKKWQAHKKAGDFESYEIWTPELHHPDPILIGVNGNTRHLIARWGESDANLVTFDDIKRELVRRWNSRWLNISLLVGGGALVLAFVIGLGIASQVSLIPAVGMIAAAAGVLVFLGTQLYKTFWAFGKNQLMQVIRRHRSVDRDMEPASA